VFRNSNSKNKESFLLLTTDGAFGCGRVKDRDAAEVAANALLIESYQQHSPKASSSSWGQRARRACAEVISHVKKKGGKDDATVILIDIESAFNK
jgi:serine/threonine protein phosphatase PrpC|tara:strand:- start:338 stop:622 length:285 start_codon:yes stop_codon:yes gene_type:complete